ncbi:MAG: hypothetical protein K8F91_24955, partial [Candidatus Obscuribacterales bacterium]|nr:hypothetical protein [Candidatus Obscuribacterales bacterium]
LSTCRIEFVYRSDEIRLEFKGGVLLDSQESDCLGGGPGHQTDLIRPAGSSFWSGLDIETYDRLRVLLTEILLIRSGCISISVSPHMLFLSRFPLNAEASLVVSEKDSAQTA